MEKNNSPTTEEVDLLCVRKRYLIMLVFNLLILSLNKVNKRDFQTIFHLKKHVNSRTGGTINTDFPKTPSPGFTVV